MCVYNIYITINDDNPTRISFVQMRQLFEYF